MAEQTWEERYEKMEESQNKLFARLDALLQTFCQTYNISLSSLHGAANSFDDASETDDDPDSIAEPIEEQSITDDIPVSPLEICELSSKKEHLSQFGLEVTMEKKSPISCTRVAVARLELRHESTLSGWWCTIEPLRAALGWKYIPDVRQHYQTRPPPSPPPQPPDRNFQKTTVGFKTTDEPTMLLLSPKWQTASRMAPFSAYVASRIVSHEYMISLLIFLRILRHYLVIMDEYASKTVCKGAVEIVKWGSREVLCNLSNGVYVSQENGVHVRNVFQDQLRGVLIHGQAYGSVFLTCTYVQRDLRKFDSKIGNVATVRQVNDEMPKRIKCVYNSHLMKYIAVGKLEVDITTFPHDSRLIPPGILFLCCLIEISGTYEVATTTYLTKSLYGLLNYINTYVQIWASGIGIWGDEMHPSIKNATVNSTRVVDQYEGVIWRGIRLHWDLNSPNGVLGAVYLESMQPSPPELIYCAMVIPLPPPKPPDTRGCTPIAVDAPKPPIEFSFISYILDSEEYCIIKGVDKVRRHEYNDEEALIQGLLHLLGGYACSICVSFGKGNDLSGGLQMREWEAHFALPYLVEILAVEPCFALWIKVKYKLQDMAFSQNGSLQQLYSGLFMLMNRNASNATHSYSYSTEIIVWFVKFVVERFCCDCGDFVVHSVQDLLIGQLYANRQYMVLVIYGLVLMGILIDSHNWMSLIFTKLFGTTLTEILLSIAQTIVIATMGDCVIINHSYAACNWFVALWSVCDLEGTQGIFYFQDSWSRKLFGMVAIVTNCAYIKDWEFQIDGLIRSKVGLSGILMVHDHFIMDSVFVALVQFLSSNLANMLAATNVEILGVLGLWNSGSIINLVGTHFFVLTGHFKEWDPSGDAYFFLTTRSLQFKQGDQGEGSLIHGEDILNLEVTWRVSTLTQHHHFDYNLEDKVDFEGEGNVMGIECSSDKSGESEQMSDDMAHEESVVVTVRGESIQGGPNM